MKAAVIQRNWRRRSGPPGAPRANGPASTGPRQRRRPDWRRARVLTALWLAGAGSLLALQPAPAAAQATEAEDILVSYASDANNLRPGYSAASVRIRARIIVCGRAVHAHYQLVPGSATAGSSYSYERRWWDVAGEPVAQPSSIAVLGFVTLDGLSHGSFRDNNVVPYSGAGCLGQTSKIEDLPASLTTTAAIQAYLNRMSLNFRTVEHIPLRDLRVEGELAARLASARLDSARHAAQADSAARARRARIDSLDDAYAARMEASRLAERMRADSVRARAASSRAESDCILAVTGARADSVRERSATAPSTSQAAGTAGTGRVDTRPRTVEQQQRDARQAERSERLADEILGEAERLFKEGQYAAAKERYTALLNIGFRGRYDAYARQQLARIEEIERGRAKVEAIEAINRALGVGVGIGWTDTPVDGLVGITMAKGIPAIRTVLFVDISTSSSHFLTDSTTAAAPETETTNYAVTVGSTVPFLSVAHIGLHGGVLYQSTSVGTYVRPLVGINVHDYGGMLMRLDVLQGTAGKYVWGVMFAFNFLD